MRVDGTRVEDLAGIGLFTKRRFVIPRWASFLGVAFMGSLRLARWSARHWRISAPLAAVWFLGCTVGSAGVVLLFVVTVVSLLMWRRLRPDSFESRAAPVIRGAWRWLRVYWPAWHAAMGGTGLVRRTPSREVYVPRVTSVRSSGCVDELRLRLLHGQTPTEVSERAEALRHVRCLPLHRH